jgi:Na+/H+-dicarboxylate symporter
MKILAVLTVLSIVSASGIGCAFTPAQIQSGTALAVDLGLGTAEVLDPGNKPRIDEDAVTVAQTLDQIIPNFFPGATAGQFASTAVTQTISLLGSKLTTSPTGSKVTEVISLAETLFLSALNSVASPTSLMSPSHQASALAFFTGAAQGIAKHLNRPDLMPPVPPASPPSTSAPTTSPPTSAPSK